MRTILLLLASSISLKAAISFDGVSFATVLDAVNLNFTNSVSFYCSARKVGDSTSGQSYFIFGKGTLTYTYSADYTYSGATLVYSFESKWNQIGTFERQYAEPASPGWITNRWLSAGFNHNHGSDNHIFYNIGALVALTASASADQITTVTTGQPLEIAKGRGGYAKWRGQIGEIAIWNTNLTSRQLQILSGSRIKGIARQIRTTNLVLHLTLDHFAGGTSLDGTNILRDYSGRGNHASPIATPLGHPEGYASYLPNE